MTPSSIAIPPFAEIPSTLPLAQFSKASSGKQTRSESKTVMEFFAGIGLIHEAVKPLGWNVVFANDNAPKKVAAYKLNYPDTQINQNDIRDLAISEIGAARLVTASFPCIDLSQAGGREGIDGEKSGVVWAFLDRVSEMHSAGIPPEFMFLENVPGLLSLHGGRSIDLLLHRIAELGYAFDLVQVDACHFLPQTRNRVFIIAMLGHQHCRKLKSLPTAHIRRYKVKEVYERSPHLPWMFFDFPPLPRRTVQLSDIIEDLPTDDARWWNADKMEYFWSYLEKHHGPILHDLLKRGEVSYLTAVRRLRRRGVREQIINLRFDGLASCLRTPLGGSSTQYVIRLHETGPKVRRLLGIEAARLQGVRLPHSAPSFTLPCSETETLHGFGDAVCVPAVRWVFENSIEKLLAGTHSALHSNMTMSFMDVDPGF